jgi:hypothetical protein
MTEAPAPFQDRQRVDAGYSRPGESTWAFLDRMCGDYWDDLRLLVNTWASHVDPTPHSKLVGMLRSGTDGQFEAAFFELYLHESLLRSGYEVEIEPSLASTSKRPDFLATRHSERLYVECTTINPHPAARGQAKRFAPLQSALDGLVAPGVVLRIELDSYGQGTLPESRLQQDIGTWLSALDVYGLPPFGDRDHEVAPFTWNEDGWLIRLCPSQLDPDSPARAAQRVMTVGPIHMSFTDDSGAVRRALETKGSRYGALDAPYIVAINATARWPNDEDLLDALYGQVQYPFRPDGTLGEAVRGRGGYFWSNGPRHEGVSGALVSRGLNPWSVCGEVPTLWLNPVATNPVEPIASWRSCRIVDQQAAFSGPAASVREHLGLSDEWPRGEAFPKIIA